jgi:hypothetical protein
MNKTQAIELLNEIIASCKSLSVGGFYTRPIRAVSTDNVELRLIASLDFDSRKRLNSIVSNRRLTMEEEKGLVIIYEPIVVGQDVNRQQVDTLAH